MTTYICKFIMIALIILPVYLLLRRPWSHWDKRETALAVFILFIVALLALAFEGTYNTPAVMLESMRYRVTAGEKSIWFHSGQSVLSFVILYQRFFLSILWETL